MEGQPRDSRLSPACFEPTGGFLLQSTNAAEFNKKYGKTGHVWQARPFSLWFDGERAGKKFQSRGWLCEGNRPVAGNLAGICGSSW